MREIELHQGEINVIQSQKGEQLRVAAATQRFVAAKAVPQQEIMRMRQDNAMHELLALTNTRDGLAALIHSQQEDKE